MKNINLATIAHYFLVGIEAGVCKEDDARDWAFAVIGAFDAPPFDIIEVSWNKPRGQLMADLKAILGIPDKAQAGQWLLGALGRQLPAEGSLWPYLRAAKHIVNASGLGDSLYYEVDGVEDELECAERGIYGTVAAARDEFCQLLTSFSPPPFKDGWSEVHFTSAST